jgi:glycosyltransferase involved in cell wall biosynthesis
MKYSCIIASYNPNKEWLYRAVESANSLFNEIVVVNDGTEDTDIFYDLHKAVDVKKTKLTLIDKSHNRGAWNARNEAINFCTGDIICVLDDDDYFDKKGVQKLKELIESNSEVASYDIWCFYLKEFNESDGIYGEGADPKTLEEFNSIPAMSWYKKSAWKDIGGYKNVTTEDWLLWLQMHKKEKRFYFFKDIVYNYNVRSNSMSRTWVGLRFEEVRQEVLAHADDYEEDI